MRFAAQSSASSIKACHRLGVTNKVHHRPILMRILSYDVKSAVQRAEAGLKGSSISVKFFTRTRQSIFGKARLHFGLWLLWTSSPTGVNTGYHHSTSSVHYWRIIRGSREACKRRRVNLGYIFLSFYNAYQTVQFYSPMHNSVYTTNFLVIFSLYHQYLFTLNQFLFNSLKYHYQYIVL